MAGIDPIYLLIIVSCILVSMTLHEAMHAFVSYWLGDDTAKMQGRLTLNPIAHIDPVMTIAMPTVLVMLGAPPFGAAKPVPFNPNNLRFGEFGAALVGAAGPLTNLALAIIAGLVIQLLAGTLDAFVLLVLGVFTLVNISFFVFNMIPFPPLDGSRVLYAFAPDFIRRGMERIEYLGVMAILIFFVVFYTFLSQPFIEVVFWLVQQLTGGKIGM